jgi:tRNA splicing endonuclease
MGADAARLHARPAHRSYTMTSGAKFGGDFLAYPGDPLLYHAQFTVRCLRADAPQHPLGLAAAARMAHAARCDALEGVRCACRAPPWLRLTTV